MAYYYKSFNDKISSSSRISYDSSTSNSLGPNLKLRLCHHHKVGGSATKELLFRFNKTYNGPRSCSCCCLGKRNVIKSQNVTKSTTTAIADELSLKSQRKIAVKETRTTATTINNNKECLPQSQTIVPTITKAASSLPSSSLFTPSSVTTTLTTPTSIYSRTQSSLSPSTPSTLASLSSRTRANLSCTCDSTNACYKNNNTTRNNSSNSIIDTYINNSSSDCVSSSSSTPLSSSLAICSSTSFSNILKLGEWCRGGTTTSQSNSRSRSSISCRSTSTNNNKFQFTSTRFIIFVLYLVLTSCVGVSLQLKN
ncbi:uncharacterized protein LOC133325419, partial [Musca vetustissima]|uniref:uncharacterized protein LOC133325419 n=1 Tax=Musca vetustissima TaxID=27455 RepID=UPI002AB600D4